MPAGGLKFSISATVSDTTERHLFEEILGAPRHPFPSQSAFSRQALDVPLYMDDSTVSLPA